MLCRYGGTRRYVRGLRVVLADGRSTALGRRTIKGVAGLSLTELFVGSEGTFGVITEATVALDSPAGDPFTLAATFPDSISAGRAVASVRARGITPSLFELMDRTVLRAVEKVARMGLDEAGALLIAQSDSGAAGAEELREIAAVIGEVERIADRDGLTIGVVGHAGDGNLHPTVVVDPSDPGSRAAAHRAFDEIAAFALTMGGTVTGEHGNGLLKVGLLEQELDPVAAELQR